FRNFAIQRCRRTGCVSVGIWSDWERYSLTRSHESFRTPIQELQPHWEKRRCRCLQKIRYSLGFCAPGYPFFKVSSITSIMPTWALLVPTGRRGQVKYPCRLIICPFRKSKVDG